VRVGTNFLVLLKFWAAEMEPSLPRVWRAVSTGSSNGKHVRTNGLELGQVVVLLFVVVVLEVLHEFVHLLVVIGSRHGQAVDLLQPLLHVLCTMSVVILSLQVREDAPGAPRGRDRRASCPSHPSSPP
jgi:hypothetical protein